MTFEEHECSCDECQEMCRRYPCRPLPEEVAEMPEDVRARLMIQPEGDGLYGVPHLQAAAVGHDGREAPDFRAGFGHVGNPLPCTFLTEEGLCELHGTCKPFEGRTAIHKMSRSVSQSPFDELVKQWESKKGRKVLRTWRHEQKLHHVKIRKR